MIMRRIAIAAVAVFFVGSALAQTLTLGVSNETTSIDPHVWNTGGNLQIGEQIFDSLVVKDHQQKLQPGLALSWKPLDDKVWEFKIRQGVKWHDGSPFTVDDVLFNHERSTTLEGYSSPPGRYQRNKQLTKVDDFTMHISTGGPYPNMPAEMSIVHVISRKHASGAKAEDFNTGKAAIGTGPYKFVEWVKGDRLVLERNNDYWGPKPAFERAIYKPIASDPARVAALLSGQVDIINDVPTADIKKLRDEPRLAITEVPSNRVIYMQMDSNRDLSPFVFNNDGSPMQPNALRLWKVRKALSLAISREALVERVMEGLAIPAGQMEGPPIFGHNPDLGPEKSDPDQAKKLLAEAGYPNGFRLTVHGPNDRYPNDAKIVEAIAQMLARIGIRTEVQTLPGATYFGRMNNGGELGNPAFSFALLGSGTDTGEALSSYTAALHTNSPKDNFGFTNRGRYSNVRVDRLLQKASVTLDDKEREKLLQQVIDISIKDYAIMPLYWQKNVWAHKKEIRYVGRTDEKTYAFAVSKAP